MSTTNLKIIALIAMLIDHIGQFIPYTPEWYHWVGRVAAPIFIYGVVIGYQHTSDKKKYIKRLYICSAGMALLNITINIIFNQSGTYITNNFFATLFLIVFIISVLSKKDKRYVIYLVLWQIIAIVLSILLSETLSYYGVLGSTTIIYQFFGAILGSILFIEGGPFFVLFGLFLYLTRMNKRSTVIIFSMFSLFFFFVSVKWGSRFDFPFIYLFPFADYQWMMIAAVPLILFYNGKRGFGLKYFFYVFYPTHIVILYLIGIYLKQV